jgi:hypothetical protein
MSADFVGAGEAVCSTTTLVDFVELPLRALGFVGAGAASTVTGADLHCDPEGVTSMMRSVPAWMPLLVKPTTTR